MKKIIVAAFLLLQTASAFAVNLTVDQTQRILAPDNKTEMTMCDPDPAAPAGCVKRVPATIGGVIQVVLTVQLIDPQTRSQDAGNVKSGIIAFETFGKPSVTLKLDEIHLILDRVDRSEDPVTIARMHQFLEPTAQASSTTAP